MPIIATIVFTKGMEHVTVKEVVNGKLHVVDQAFGEDARQELTVDDREGVGLVKIWGDEVLSDGSKRPHNRQLELRSGQEYGFPHPKMSALAEIRNFPTLDALVNEIKSRL
ncbi:hypothetical protein [Sinorhizobium americanum]|uniref:Uncharacterized protein n=1 Tax=Sinorhizobium americanum TaxID=194963 RepID=A0A4R2BRG0_9HYPH|nr:hypothetical protein [Sinorhizobium americanum]TCN30181.1 hypothetical protein EV184_10852 [Sinorhizobium americanum]